MSTVRPPTLDDAGALWSVVERTALDAGLAAVGCASAAHLQPARSVLPTRKAEGLAGSMQFTYRNPDRSTDPGHIAPDAAALVVGAWPYQRQRVPAPAAAAGRVATYAWRDHYGDLRAALEVAADVLRSEGWWARIHLDDNHLVDRNVAHAAGIGWYGKNANLLLPGHGSWFVLGSIVTNAPLAPTGPPLSDGCGPCERCFEGCPTDAIVAPGIVDARRCIAWLVQGPGEIPVEFRAAIGDRIYGCDDCQEVCPPNQQQTGVPPAEADADPFIEIEWILTATDDELMARVGRWYLADRNPNVVRRTALVILGNIGSGANPTHRALLDVYLHHENPLLAEHAAWAAEQLGAS